MEFTLQGVKNEQYYTKEKVRNEQLKCGPYNLSLSIIGWWQHAFVEHTQKLNFIIIFIYCMYTLLIQGQKTSNFTVRYIVNLR